MSSVPLLKSFRFWSGCIAFSLNVPILLSTGLAAMPALLLSAVSFAGIALGGCLPLLIRPFSDNRIRMWNIDREWTTAIMASMAMAAGTMVISRLPITSSLAALTVGWSFMYAGGKFGCHLYGCCDWSARYFIHVISLPLLETFVALVLGLGLGILLILSIKPLVILSAFLLGHGSLRTMSVVLRDAHLTARPTWKIDGPVFLAMGLIALLVNGVSAL